MTPLEVTLLALLLLVALTSAPALAWLAWRVYALKRDAADRDKQQGKKKQALGLEYRAATPAARDVLERAQRVFAALQKGGCASARDMFVQQKDAVVEFVRGLDASQRSCDTARAVARDTARQLAERLRDEAPSVDARELQDAVAALWDAALDAVCVGGTVSPDRLGGLMDDLYRSVCG